MRRSIPLICTVFFFFFFVSFVNAKDITFTLSREGLEDDQELELTASMSGFQSGDELYMKGVFYKKGLTNYFGYTKYNDVWVKNSSSISQQRKITVGQWDQHLQIRSDYADSGFTNSGPYMLKIGYYTVSSDGKISSVQWSSTEREVYIQKSEPTRTSTLVAPSPTPFNTIIQKPQSTLIQPVVSPSMLEQKEKFEIVLSTNSTEMKNDEYINNLENDLNTSTVSAETKNEQKLFDLSIKRIVIAGISVVGLCTGILSVVSVVRTIRKRYMLDKNNV